MPDFNRVRQVFEGNDRLSSTVRTIKQSFEALSRSLGETQKESTEVSVGFRELDRMLDEVGETATPHTSNRFAFLQEAIENTVTPEGIVSIRQLQNELDSVQEETGLTDAGFRKLKETGEELAREFFQTSINAADLKQNIRELGEQGTLSAVQVSNLERAIDNVAEQGEIRSIEAFKDRLEEVGMIAGLDSAVLNEMNREVDKLMINMLESSGAMSEATAVALGLGQAYRNAERGVDELREELRGSAADMVNTSLAAIANAAALELLAVAADDAEKEFEEMHRALNDLIPENPITTLNLGPVNISLSSMLTTITSLTTIIGPLIIGMLGFAAALGAIVTAAAAFMGAGLFEFLGQIEEKFASVEDRTQAIEALMGGLGKALRDAFQPLFDTQFAGQTPMEFFINSIRGGLQVVRQFATILAGILDLRSVERFFDSVSTALFTGDGGPSMFEAITDSINRLEPILTSFFVFFINNMPEFIQFVTEVSEDTLPALGSIIMDILPMFGALIRFGADLFEVFALLISVASDIVGLFTGVVDFFDEVLGPAIDLGAAIEDLAAAFVGLMIILAAANSLFTFATTLYEAAQSAALLLSGAYQVLGGSALSASGAVQALNTSLATTVTLLTTIASILAPIAAIFGFTLAVGEGVKRAFPRAAERGKAGRPWSPGGRSITAAEQQQIQNTSRGPVIQILGDVTDPERFSRKVRNAMNQNNQRNSSRTTGSRVDR